MDDFEILSHTDLVEKCRELTDRNATLEACIRAAIDEYRTMKISAWTASTMAALLRHALREPSHGRN
jgi:hypothetical protein